MTEFILVAFSLNYDLDVILFHVFFLAYVVIIFGNLAIITVTCYDSRLHLPMYFFLGNISLLELSISSVVIPKLLAILLPFKKTITFVGCFVQCYFYFALGTADFMLLAVMSYDRYLAICNPLHYVNIMNWNTCLCLACFSWTGGFLIDLVPGFIKATMPFCKGNTINHFFCDSLPIMKLSCMDTTFLQLLDFFLFSFIILGSLFITIWTYMMIAITIFKIPTVSGRTKAFSTCISHLILVCLGYGGTIFLYIIPKGNYYMSYNKLVSIVTIFITPVLSPFIFCLRNNVVQVALEDMYVRLKKSVLE
ncbi:olfactory receptor 6J1-like [Pyxicephalus adspersus]